mmetsp:Transcript_13310/g.41130  ORF Transcript_13310/g.41130 Transcript_13310/m.41130 type:complete len:212 (-) Transcript_13310:483-1118(-)
MSPQRCAWSSGKTTVARLLRSSGNAFWSTDWRYDSGALGARAWISLATSSRRNTGSSESPLMSSCSRSMVPNGSTARTSSHITSMPPVVLRKAQIASRRNLVKRVQRAPLKKSTRTSNDKMMDLSLALRNAEKSTTSLNRYFNRASSVASASRFASSASTVVAQVFNIIPAGSSSSQTESSGARRVLRYAIPAEEGSRTMSRAWSATASWR